MIKLNHLIKEHLIYEGLIHSVSKSTFKDMVDRWGALEDKMSVSPVKDKNKILLQFKSNPTEKELDSLLKLINNLGWFISSFSTIQNKKWNKFDKNILMGALKYSTLLLFQVEAKFDLEVTDQSFGILYHITPSINDGRIQKVGLVPKSLNKIAYHPERIYFGKTESDVESLLPRFFKLDPKIREYSIYEVDINREIKLNSQLRLFQDSNFENGLYTLSNIRKENLKFVRKITI